MANFALFAKLGLDTSAFQKGLTKADSKTKNFKATLSSLKGVLALGTFVSAAKSVGKYVQEMENAAKIANLSTTEFQKFSFATKKVGIEQEKAADILKDVSDKVGDFLATGAGSMADFFENIAPKVGITADAFRNLNGKDALQLYVSSLEKANVSQNEMTFYMEAIASDATALLPLLRDNGKALGEYADQAERVGAVMSKDTTAAIKQTADSFDTALNVAVATGAKTFRFFQQVTEDVLAVGASLITQENVIAQLHEDRYKAQRRLNTAVSQYAEAVDGAVIANEIFADIFKEDLSLPTFEEKETGKKKIAEMIRMRELNLESERIKRAELELLRAISKGEDEKASKIEREIQLRKDALDIAKKYKISLEEAMNLVNGAGENNSVSNMEKAAKELKKLELELIKAQASGEKEVIKELEKKIKILQQALQIQKDHNISMEEAFNLAKKIAEQEEEETSKPDTKPEDTRGDFARELTGEELRKAASNAKEGVRFERMADGTFQQFTNGKKGGRFTEEQLQAGLEKQVESDPSQKTLESIEKILEGKFVNE